MGSSQIQGDLWAARAREWADLQEGSFRQLYEAAFSAAHVGKGTSLLDVGCGAGLALEMAQARGAKVSGVDAAAARRTARRFDGGSFPRLDKGRA